MRIKYPKPAPAGINQFNKNMEKISLPDPKDKKNMTAPDMFEGDKVQVFSKRTGLWIGTVRPGEEDTIQELAGPAEIKKEHIKNQLSIF